jgi:hypothetical protein
MPERRYRAWTFRAEQGSGQARDLVDAVVAYALPFMRRLTELSQLCEALDQGVGYEHQIAYRRPVAWMLLGDAARARDVLDEFTAKLGARSDLAAEEFRRFSEALTRRLGTLMSGR